MKISSYVVEDCYMIFSISTFTFACNHLADAVIITNSSNWRLR